MESDYESYSGELADSTRKNAHYNPNCLLIDAEEQPVAANYY